MAPAAPAALGFGLVHPVQNLQVQQSVSGILVLPFVLVVFVVVVVVMLVVLVFIVLCPPVAPVYCIVIVWRPFNFKQMICLNCYQITVYALIIAFRAMIVKGFMIKF